MKGARVGVFEDFPALQEMFKSWLEMYGHEVVMTATSLKEAKEVIEQADPGSLDVALVDGDLGENPHEGAEIIKSLRQKMGEIAIVNVSGEYPADGADTHIPKGKVEQIMTYILQLRPETSDKS